MKGGGDLPRKKFEIQDVSKMTVANIRKAYTALAEQYIKTTEMIFCHSCGELKPRDKFYVSTDPGNKSGYTHVCKECAYDIALRKDINGEYHEPTLESVQQALRILNKPFLEKIWESSISEYTNTALGKAKNNVWTSYIKNIQMINYEGLTWEQSDIFKTSFKYNDEIEKEKISNRSDEIQETYTKNKDDTIRLLGYDPFDKESEIDKPFLYSQLIGYLDSSEETNDDKMRVSSIIEIVKGFSHIEKINDIIASLMRDTINIDKNISTIRTLEDTKSKITGNINKLAESSCISLKNSKNAAKGENTWTGKIKKIKDMNLREGEVNGFDISTCRGMKQVMDMSNASIIEQLKLDDSDYAEMLAQQREMITNLHRDIAHYKEISRILLRENFDLRDTMREKGMLSEEDLVDLDNVYSCFSDVSEEIESDSDG